MLTQGSRSVLVLVSALHACSPTAPAELPVADAAPSSEATHEATSASAREPGPHSDSAASSPDASVNGPDAAPSQVVGDASRASAPRVSDRDAAPDDAALPLPPRMPDLDAALGDGGPLRAADRDAAPTDAWVFQPDASLRNPRARHTIVADIPEAENMFFTEDGRLFVSGGESVFEIKRDAAGVWSKTDLFDENCLVEGITHANGYIYGVCSLTELATFGEAYLLGGELSAQPHMRIIGRLDDLGIPNGMDVDRHGNIYTSYSGMDTIAKLVLSEPLKLARVEVWAKDLPTVNGLRFIGDFVYFTTMNIDTLTTHLGRIPIQPDGSAGRAEYLLARDLALFDDLGSFADGLMITEYIAGRLLFFRDGKVLAETPDETFFAPSAVIQGKPPMFRENQLLVTEKGVLGVRGETDGDRLSVFDL